VEKNTGDRRLRMNKIKCFIGIMLCFVLVGCAPPLVFFGAGAAAGVAGYKFYEGSLTVIFQAPFEDTWDATLKALDKMNIQVDNASHTITSGKISAKLSDKKPVSISMTYKSPKETEVVIKVDYLGDQKTSMAIKEEIRKVLVNE
jgi:hypothetical protein